MPQYISLRKFSKLAGVSPATVSHVFSNPSSVADTTVKRVLNLAEQVGFTPSAVARAAFGEATRSIGVMTSTVFIGLIRCIQDRLVQADYLPILISMEGPASDAVTRMLKHKVDGLILGVCDERLNFSEICERQMVRLPTVVLETKRPWLWADSVLNDDYDGGVQAANHLLALGHRRFGVIKFGEDIVSNCIDRIKGFRDTIVAAGGVLDDNFIGPDYFSGSTENHASDMIRKIRQIISKPNVPTAFFCTTDYLALYFYEAAKQENRRIPADFSVVGFGDLDFSPYLHVSMTTLRQGVKQLGARAAELILNRIREPESPLQNVLVPVELVVRESTTQPRKE
jgi:LacI family transcriptional regulator